MLDRLNLFKKTKTKQVLSCSGPYKNGIFHVTFDFSLVAPFHSSSLVIICSVLEMS